jgi:hypothetical protein
VAQEDAAVAAHVADIYSTLGYASDAFKALREAEAVRPNAAVLLTTHAVIALECVSCGRGGR